MMTALRHPEETPMADYATGKICYIEIPAVNVARSAGFYETCFGWEMRTRADGSRAFDDTVHQVSGTFVTGRPPAHEPGLVVHIMVADIKAVIVAIEANGGVIVQPVDPTSPEVYALFRDPAGNVFGIYEERTLAGRA
jgi:predicted enzyme related to lactoylglutathione lyase